MIIRNKKFLLLAGLSALSLQAQADSTFSVTQRSIHGSTGLSVTDSFTSVGTSVPGKPTVSTTVATVKETKNAATATDPASITRLTTYSVTTTAYSDSSAMTDTYTATVGSPMVTTGVQKVRLFGAVKSMIAQDLTFQLVAHGGYANFVDDDGDPAVPSAPGLKYVFAGAPVANLTGYSSPNSPLYDTQTVANQYRESSDFLPLTFKAGETKYFETQISTIEHSSIADFAIIFASMPSGSQVMSSKVTHFTESVTTAVPEPQSYALLLAGLSVLGFVAHRKKRSEP